MEFECPKVMEEFLKNKMDLFNRTSPDFIKPVDSSSEMINYNDYSTV